MSEPESTASQFLGTASFNCEASGYPQPTIQWYKDDLQLSGKTCPVLIVENVSPDERGQYHCTATNSEGVISSSNALLQINDTQQFSVPVFIPSPGSGPFDGLDNGLTPELLDAIQQFVQDLNREASGRNVSAPNSSSVFVDSVRLLDNSTVLTEAE